MKKSPSIEKRNNNNESTPKRQKLMRSHVKSASTVSLTPVSSQKELNANDASNKLLIDDEKRVMVTSPLSLEASVKCPITDNVINQCQKIIAMSTKNECMKVPNEEVHSNFESAQN